MFVLNIDKVLTSNSLFGEKFTEQKNWVKPVTIAVHQIGSTRFTHLPCQYQLLEAECQGPFLDALPSTCRNELWVCPEMKFVHFWSFESPNPPLLANIIFWLNPSYPPE